MLFILDGLQYCVQWGPLAIIVIFQPEIRSVLENLNEIGIKVPTFLTKGLEVVQKMARAKEKGLIKTKGKGEKGAER